MAAKTLPEQSVLLQLLRYVPETGKLFWIERPISAFDTLRIANSWNAKWAGKEAFTCTANGYKIGRILSVGYFAHRVIFKMMTGLDPDEVDHIDGDTSNNRWGNLRDVDHSTNTRNTSRRKDCTSGVTGVHWEKDSRKWRCFVGENNLGRFSCFGAAIKARKIAHVEYGYSPRHGTTNVLRETIQT